ncbi:hypothetical protein OG711_39030 (plasmid) [Streptomyces uncialis]|uniref:hypothetical protein n=1 Tax=Streptomyces uncialis TaxID=1048205 RepID=UPI002E33CC36|nr:hypothetical protein [Streptomyces uncialis]WTE16037.1 hypothetical protein OG924_37505 [Streptomyces uncialis]
MVLSVSAVLLLAIAVFLLIRNGSLTTGPALAAGGLGFFLASTGLATPINETLTALADLVHQLSI